VIAAWLALILWGTAPEQAWAKPATTLKIPETSLFDPDGENEWFVRADVTGDLQLKGAFGGGLAAGHMGEHVFLDLSLMYVRTNYGAIRVAQEDATGASPLNPNSEIGRSRSTSDSGSVTSFGPGIGFIYKLFGSARWVEMGRFGVNYAQFQDSVNGLTFRGPLFNFHAAAGYKIGPLMFSPGVTWNLGYVTNTTDANTADFAHNRFLPIQWWSLQLAMYVWF
jgi:hypothetical protein